MHSANFFCLALIHLDAPTSGQTSFVSYTDNSCTIIFQVVVNLCLSVVILCLLFCKFASFCGYFVSYCICCASLCVCFECSCANFWLRALVFLYCLVDFCLFVKVLNLDVVIMYF